MLGLRDWPPSEVSLFSSYYVRMIGLFQTLDWLPGVRAMAEEALKVATSDEEAVKMCALAFKCALQLKDYPQAYRYILKVIYKRFYSYFSAVLA